MPWPMAVSPVRNADEIVACIARYSVTKDRDLIKSVIPAALHPDGQVNEEGLAKDLAFVKTLGLVKSAVPVADVVDMSFAKAAVAEPRTLSQGTLGLSGGDSIVAGLDGKYSPNVAAITAMMSIGMLAAGDFVRPPSGHTCHDYRCDAWRRQPLLRPCWAAASALMIDPASAQIKWSLPTAYPADNFHSQNLNALRPGSGGM